MYYRLCNMLISLFTSVILTRFILYYYIAIYIILLYCNYVLYYMLHVILSSQELIYLYTFSMLLYAAIVLMLHVILHWPLNPTGGQKARVVFVELSLMAPHLLFLDEVRLHTYIVLCVYTISFYCAVIYWCYIFHILLNYT